VSANGRLSFELTDEALEALAQRVAAILAEREPLTPSAWLDTKAAAEYLSCTPDRVHDLVGLRRLCPSRDGRRLLFRREDLDAYLEASA
jgi:excisionase family DNA binding protein